MTLKKPLISLIQEVGEPGRVLFKSWMLRGKLLQ